MKLWIFLTFQNGSSANLLSTSAPVKISWRGHNFFFFFWVVGEFGKSNDHNVFGQKKLLKYMSPSVHKKCPYSEFFWSVFRPNVGKYRPDKLRVWTLFTQCLYYRVVFRILSKIFDRNFSKNLLWIKKSSEHLKIWTVSLLNTIPCSWKTQ